jgi:hypothetical protein
VEAVVFHNASKPEVRKKLESFVVVQLHCDHKDQKKKDFALDLQERLTGEPTQPQYVVYDPRSERVLRRWAYVLDHGFWLKQLDEALADYRAGVK